MKIRKMENEMAFDHAKIQELLAITETRKLTPSERKIVREQIGFYYEKKLAGLQEKLFATLELHTPGKLDPFEIDQYIHLYHRQSQELYKYINYYHSFSNDSLPEWLRDMDDEERGIRVWEPDTELSLQKDKKDLGE